MHVNIVQVSTQKCMQNDYSSRTYNLYKWIKMVPLISNRCKLNELPTTKLLVIIECLIDKLAFGVNTSTDASFLVKMYYCS